MHFLATLALSLSRLVRDAGNLELGASFAGRAHMALALGLGVVAGLTSYSTNSHIGKYCAWWSGKPTTSFVVAKDFRSVLFAEAASTVEILGTWALGSKVIL